MNQRSYFKLAALREGVSGDQAVLSDYAEEVSLLHGLARDEGERRFRRLLEIYHYGSDEGTPEEWGELHGGDDFLASCIRISKPFRFRDLGTIPLVLDGIRKHLRTASSPARVLDYGGGFGNDAIVYERMGFDAHYADLTWLVNTQAVIKRFELRRLDIPVHDSYALPPERFDVITAIDVLEHFYDVDEAAARLMARVPRGALLCPANAFSSITYDGDHLDKNRVYVELFPILARAAGFERVAFDPPLEIYRRESEPPADVREDEEALKRLLYRTTHDHCLTRCRELLDVVGGGSGVAWDKLIGKVTHTAADGDQPQPSRAYALAVRLAPPSLKRAVWRRRQRAVEGDLANRSDPTTALASLADHVAVLRIAQHRLRRLGP